MVFSSPEFLFAFLPIFMALYFLCPGRKIKNVWLLIASLFFYAWGEPVYVVLMIVSIVVNWALALALDREARNSMGGGWLFLQSCRFSERHCPEKCDSRYCRRVQSARYWLFQV